MAMLNRSGSEKKITMDLSYREILIIVSWWEDHVIDSEHDKDELRILVESEDEFLANKINALAGYPIIYTKATDLVEE